MDVTSENRPRFGIITTQSCDLAEERPDPRQPWLAVAPVYELAEGSSLLARDYVSRLEPPSLEGTWVADLRIEMPFEKSLLVGRTPIEAFPSEDGYIHFANLLARRRGRPALASVFHDVLTQTARGIKNESGEQRALARRVREEIYKLLLAIDDGTRLQPIAAKLYVVTCGPPGTEIRAWFDRWWNDARVVGADQGLQLHATGWIDARAADLRLLDDLIEMRNPLFG